jgi:hypothetical protein
MSHRRPKKSHKKEKESGEHRAVEILTVGWLLTVITALACEIGSLASSLAVSQFGAGIIVGRLAGLLLFAAVIIGFISLIIAPVVLKSRKTPTPRVVIVVAICAGILPMLTMYWQLAHAQ